jgi:hypothetical protein
VESSCELGNEPSGSIKCRELPNGCTTRGLSSGTQLHCLLIMFLFMYCLFNDALTSLPRICLVEQRKTAKNMGQIVN